MSNTPSVDSLNGAVFPPMKYLVITGGTLSGIGKGTTISSIGVVLKSMGFRVTAIKIDPYLNVDAGTMSPYEHGEVYVLEDGGEADLDLGNYERFLNVTLSRDHNITTGKIYESVIRRERKGEYLGKTVQVVPHVTDAIQEWIRRVSVKCVDQQTGPADICLIEVGGTVGDIESSVYLEALQQFSYKAGLENFCLCHVSFVPVLGEGRQVEQKTKPTQHGVKELRQAGMRPDFIFCRSDIELTAAARAKIAVFAQVAPENVISVHNVSNIYRVPLIIHDQRFGELVCKRLGLSPRTQTGHRMAYDTPAYSIQRWRALADAVDNSTEPLRIGIVGKYTGTSDSYLSVVKALQHAANTAQLKLEIVWIESSSLEEDESTDEGREAWTLLKSVDGVLCPGGFGDRGILGKMASARYCRESSVPYLGICLGMQTAVIEFCRTVLALPDANSEEFCKETQNKVIVFMPEVNAEVMGGTMRLGNRATILRERDSLAYKLYGSNPVVYERHRHRYEVNPEYVPAMQEKGLRFVGQDEKGQRMEIAELTDHPFFLCTQYHPEFTSRPIRPNPCFMGFVLASKGMLEKRMDLFDLTRTTKHTTSA